MTGEEADGFILQLADLYLTEYMVKAVKDAAVEAGRDPSEVKICVAAPAYVAEDDSPEALAHTREQCRWFGGMVGNHVADLVCQVGERSAAGARGTHRLHQGPRGLRLLHHGRSDNPDTKFVPDEIVDRFCLIGTAEQHVEKLKALRALGVDQFAVYDMHDAQEAVIDAYGSKVIRSGQADNSAPGGRPPAAHRRRRRRYSGHRSSSPYVSFPPVREGDHRTTASAQPPTVLPARPLPSLLT